MLARATNENEQITMPMQIATISYTSIMRLIVNEINMVFLYEVASIYRPIELELRRMLIVECFLLFCLFKDLFPL